MRKTALLIAALACAAVSLAAAGVSGAAVDGSAEDERRHAHGRRGDVPVPADLEVDPGLRPGVGNADQLLADRLGRRHRGDHGPDGRLRRLRRAALAGQFDACKGCIQIPWALSATAVIYNVPGAPQGLKLTPAIISQIYSG